ncbi:cmgc srpk protein kinase [Moniliophthora roreri MCA 2997]|uniref:non-specific serine/threonine protein kinase n=1 Tax=Moniliophthora roreri (strain MCA 2997) TaxID=1381753 RepID=V2XZD6_MONRO|nr:cmgc srpk protein kinase [Moniliophthora roreri MCA 2997]
MANNLACAKYQYVVTANGPKILPVEDTPSKDEESPADYNAGGYLQVKVGDTFKNGRYRVIRKLGWGHFSTVWLVKDAHLSCHSALKVVKSAGRYAETARDEIKLLSKVASFSPTHPGRQYIVSFLDSFSHQGPEAQHICIVFEPLGENLLALIERNRKKGVPRSLVKLIARQVLLGLQYLHDECDLVHTDIKPENILISIPDIEAHIYNELLQSPSPTSRRVGVPLPNKSRTGVTIPLNQRGSRRQVQIFESQPLSSPGRSAGAHGHGSFSMSLGASAGSGSGPNSAASSYIAQMHMTRLSSASNVTANGPKLSSSAPKVPSGLSMTNPANEKLQTSKSTPNVNPSKITPHSPPQPNGDPNNSPSTSSSSSSMTSSHSAGAGSSSNYSTPPTSLSHSLGTAIGSVLTMPRKIPDSRVHVLPPIADHAGSERVGLPMKKSKGKEKESSQGLSTSWMDKVSKQSSWKDTISFSLGSSYKSSSSRDESKPDRSAQPQSRSHSGVSGSWKDPGLAAPAPAVVVSTAVRADGEEEGEDYFRIAGSSGTGSSDTSKSESSSATATVARPSPSGTVRSEIPKAPESRSGSSSINKSEFAVKPINRPSNGNNPSLLSQTAPRASSGTATRTSPSHHTSQLSAHVHKHPPPNDRPAADSDVTPQKSSSRTKARLSGPKVIIPTATNIDVTPTASPNAPPPSPNDASPIPFSYTKPVAVPPPTNNVPTTDSTPVPYPLTIPRSTHFPPPVLIKIADLGNATPSKKHYTEEIQTRQYRAPEAIVGRKDWNTTADIWSVACVVFELLAGEYLFDPQGQGELFTKDDDHMAQIIELLGDYALEAKMGGKYSRDLFDHQGNLRYIKTLKPWPLKRVMIEKYLFTEEDSQALCDFLLPMLVIDFKHRASARDMVDHEWLKITESDGPCDEW